MAKTHFAFCSTALALATLTAVLTGCGSSYSNATSSSTPTVLPGVALKGGVHGGQQPVAGATITLYAASTAGYAATATSLLTSVVKTNANGAFSITGAYSCSAGQQLYLVATGGNPGGGTNPNLALMAALGDCSTLSASTVVNITEVTTVAGSFALAPFMTGISTLGTTTTNTSGLAHAFASVNKLVNTTNGLAPGSALPTGAVGPTSELNTLADIMANCINSTGGAAGSNTACGEFFTLTTPPGGTAPTDTIQAALNIAHNPTQNVTALYNTTPPIAPFNPQLSAAPTDWTLAVKYTASGMSTPRSTTIDANGNVWIANSGNNTVTVLAQSGVPVSGSPFTGNGLNAPAAVALDINGNAWVANSGGSTVSVFTPSGAAYGSSPFSGAGTISAPSAIAIDAPGNIWVANKGNSSLTELTGSGTYAQQVTADIASPTALAIDPR